jgi:hypothetical protein
MNAPTWAGMPAITSPTREPDVRCRAGATSVSPRSPRREQRQRRVPLENLVHQIRPDR